MSPGNTYRELMYHSDPSVHRWWNELRARPSWKELDSEAEK
jgi:hypothetical protein